MTDDLEQRLREDAKAGVGAGSDWSAEECATYWARQCSTARRNAAEAADELARLRAENEAFRKERETLAQNRRVNEAIQTTLEKGELHISSDGWLARTAAIRTGEAK